MAVQVLVTTKPDPIFENERVKDGGRSQAIWKPSGQSKASVEAAIEVLRNYCEEKCCTEGGV
jgi:hypothetical protein